MYSTVLRESTKDLEKYLSEDPDCEVTIGDLNVLSKIHNARLQELRYLMEYQQGVSENNIESRIFSPFQTALNMLAMILLFIGWLEQAYIRWKKKREMKQTQPPKAG